MNKPYLIMRWCILEDLELRDDNLTYLIDF